MTVTLQQLKDELSVLSTMTKSKPHFLTEALVEVLNNEWKVNAVESGRSLYHQLEVTEGKKYLKVWERLNRDGVEDTTRSCWMFVDKNDGACYKPASYKAPAKGIRFWIDQLVDQPEICDPYGSFLYVR
tara:strand:+ start:463 stop:849 length:387 start_codon:yes stop_codon:yes gene_type:complete